MKIGDMIFHKGRLIAKAARNISIPEGAEYRFPWPVSDRQRELPPLEYDAIGHIASIRRIFSRGGVEIWELFIPEGADMDVSWGQIGLFVPHDQNPGSDPAQMVTAIDLLLEELGGRFWHFADYLRSMRGYFAARAQQEKVKL